MTQHPSFFTLKNLGFNYPNQQPVLQDISLQLQKGDALCLAGMNGCGKTTLLLLLAGLLERNTGTITACCNEKECILDATDLRNQSALVMQDADIQIVGTTVEEDAMLTATLIVQKTYTKSQEIQEKAQELVLATLTKFNLESMLNRQVQHLSYGQKRKLCLATALMTNPQFLLLDEPLSGLDYPATLELMQILVQCQKDGTILVFSTHTVEPFIPIITKVLLLHPKHPALCGTLNAMQEHFFLYALQPIK